MTTEVLMLLATLGLLFLLTSVQGAITLAIFGPAQAAGSRDAIPFPQQGVGGRFYRAIENLKENLFYFVPLVLVTAILGISNPLTVLGSQLFFASRLAHAVLYVAGVPWIRTAAFFGGIVGCAMIVAGLVGQ